MRIKEGSLWSTVHIIPKKVTVISLTNKHHNTHIPSWFLQVLILKRYYATTKLLSLENNLARLFIYSTPVDLSCMSYLLIHLIDYCALIHIKFAGRQLVGVWLPALKCCLVYKGYVTIKYCKTNENNFVHSRILGGVKYYSCILACVQCPSLYIYWCAFNLLCQYQYHYYTSWPVFNTCENRVTACGGTPTKYCDAVVSVAWHRPSCLQLNIETSDCNLTTHCTKK